MTNAQRSIYHPSDPSKWASVPGKVQDALDQLAGGGGPVVTFDVNAPVWSEGGTPYPERQLVSDGGFSWIALRDTSEKPIGAEEAPAWALPDSPSWTNRTTSSAPSYTGLQVTIPDMATIVSIRVWIPEVDPANITYRIWVGDITDPDRYTLVFSQDLTTVALEVGWLTINFTGALWLPGTKLEFTLEALKTAGSDTQWSADWDYDGTGSGDPDENKFTRNGGHTILNISKTDVNDGNQGANLLLLKPGDELRVEERNTPSRWDQYTVTDPVEDNGSWVLVPVVRIDDGGTVRTNTCTITATIRAAAGDMPYVELTDYWVDNLPAGAIVKGFAVTAAEDIEASLDDNAYGMDLFGTYIFVSEDWFPIGNLSGRQVGGGGSDDPAPATVRQSISLTDTGSQLWTDSAEKAIAFGTEYNVAGTGLVHDTSETGAIEVTEAGTYWLEATGSIGNTPGAAPVNSWRIRFDENQGSGWSPISAPIVTIASAISENRNPLVKALVTAQAGWKYRALMARVQGDGFGTITSQTFYLNMDGPTGE